VSKSLKSALGQDAGAPLSVIVAGGVGICLLVALAAFLGFARQSSEEKRELNARQVFKVSTDAKMRAVEQCLTYQLGLDPHGWKGRGTRTDWHPVWNTKVQVTTLGAMTEVTMWTPRGRPLREREKSALQSCALIFPLTAPARRSI
jgi:hypothetical protein